MTRPSIRRQLPALYRLSVVLVGTAVLGAFAKNAPLSVDLGALVFLALIAFVAERSPLELPGYGMVSGLEAAVMTALFLEQAVAAVAILGVGVFARSLRRKQSFRWDYSLYTFFQLALCFAGPFALLEWLAPNSLVGFAAAGMAAAYLDACCAAFHLYLLQNCLGHPGTRIEWARIRLMGMALLPLSLLLGSCLQLGFVTTALLCVPLAVAFKGLKSYVDTLREAREVVTSLVEAAEKREIGLVGHAERVAGFAGDIAREMRLKERTVRRIVTAARMHDLGKIGIDESVLNKTEALNEADIASLRRHPEVGARVAAHLSLGKQEAEFIHYHHENFDGSGYPMGLAGHAIPQGARILAVAEAFDCMVSSERRRSKLTTNAALLELESAQGRQFDPTVVAAFRSVISKRIAC